MRVLSDLGTLRFELLLHDLTAPRTDLVPDFHKVDIRIDEYEDIDQDYQSGLDISNHFQAPSLICNEQVGCNLLSELGHRLLPAKAVGAS